MDVMVLVLFVFGLVLLVAGAEVLVKGASRLASAVGISPLVVGLTVVAFGTSAPEMAVSVQAALSGQAGADIAVGNVVGSNIFNILAVLGLSSLVAPAGINVSPSAQSFDIPVMIAVAVACLPVFFTGYTISRWEGLLFLGYYLAYTLFLVLTASGNAVLDTFGSAMVFFVVPLTVITLFIAVARQFRSRQV